MANAMSLRHNHTNPTTEKQMMTLSIQWVNATLKLMLLRKGVLND